MPHHSREATDPWWQRAPRRALRWLEEWPPLRRLDYLTPRPALTLGVGIGGALAAVAVLRPGPLSWWLTVLGIVAGVTLVISARPVAVWEHPPQRGESLLDMVAIEGGWFVMGSPLWERGRRSNETQHQVKLTSYRMSRTLITREQYRHVMGEDPGSGGDRHPVTEVSWFDAVSFCNALSQLEGLPPCYEIEGERVSWIADDGGYRLPTEAEWEHAARAGSKGRWPFPASELEKHAWYRANSGKELQEVATREPNPWGLHDLHGNAWEWCWDRYGSYGWWYARDPRDPGASRLLKSTSSHPESTRSGRRVLRGGAFFNVPRDLRSAYRVRAWPVNRNWRFGFRCVRRPVRQLDPSSS